MGAEDVGRLRPRVVICLKQGDSFLQVETRNPGSRLLCGFSALHPFFLRREKNLIEGLERTATEIFSIFQ